MADGGAVFSVGSIAWAGSLSHNGYDNNVARITHNVLRRFVSDENFATTVDTPRAMAKREEATI